MNTSNFTHVFFDLDHTLWDFEKNSRIAFEKIVEKHTLGIDLETYLKVYSPINEAYWDWYRDGKVTKEELRYKRFEDTFTRLQLDFSPEKINRFADDYIHHLPEANCLLPGVLEMLAYLQTKYVLHIITDGFQEVQEKKLTNANIIHYFATLTTSDEVGAKKPNPKIFAHALQKAGAQKKESIMIGDNLRADVQGALNFGIDAIHYSYKKEHQGKTISHYENVRTLL